MCGVATRENRTDTYPGRMHPCQHTIRYTHAPAGRSGRKHALIAGPNDARTSGDVPATEQARGARDQSARSSGLPEAQPPMPERLPCKLALSNAGSRRHRSPVRAAANPPAEAAAAWSLAAEGAATDRGSASLLRRDPSGRAKGVAKLRKKRRGAAWACFGPIAARRCRRGQHLRQRDGRRRHGPAFPHMPIADPRGLRRHRKPPRGRSSRGQQLI